jgi:hypothetical protein
MRTVCGVCERRVVEYREIEYCEINGENLACLSRVLYMQRIFVCVTVAQCVALHRQSPTETAVLQIEKSRWEVILPARDLEINLSGGMVPSHIQCIFSPHYYG